MGYGWSCPSHGSHLDACYTLTSIVAPLVPSISCIVLGACSVTEILFIRNKIFNFGLWNDFSENSVPAPKILHDTFFDT